MGKPNDTKGMALEYFQSGVEKFLDGLQERARQDFLKALDFDPNLTLAYCYLSTIYTEDDDPDAGIVFCEKGLRIEPENSYLHFCLGVAYDAKGLKQEALKEYHVYHADHPDDPECLFSMACVFDQIGSSQEAENYYQRVISIDPSHHKACFNLALKKADHGSVMEASELLKKACESKPD